MQIFVLGSPKLHFIFKNLYALRTKFFIFATDLKPFFALLVKNLSDVEILLLVSTYKHFK